MARTKRIQEKVKARHLKTKAKPSVNLSAVKEVNPGIVVRFMKLDVA